MKRDVVAIINQELQKDLQCLIRSHLKNRILVQSQGGSKFQPAGILKYVEDLKRGSNAGFGPKDIFEITSIFPGRYTMSKHSHSFTDEYDGFVGFGFNRETDENTIIYYLQKFSDDSLMQTLVKRLTDQDLADIFNLLTRLLKAHLTEEEYHHLFLKE